MNYKLRKTNGITLIALVITIIVLLILAAVSIAMLTGENGILTQANKAKEETRAASVQEVIDLWKTNQKADGLAGSSTAQTKAELLVDLKEQNLITPEEYTKLSNGETITIGSKTISFAKTLVEAFKAGEIKVGDYVNYTPIEGKTTNVKKEETGWDETQNYTVDTTTTWRVLGLSENEENLLLTSGSPIKKDGENPYLILQGAESYYNCEDALDKICSIYQNGFAVESRSMKIEDINQALGITVDKTENKAYKTDDETKTELPFGGFFGHYEYQTGNYMPENYLKETYPDNEKYQALVSKDVGDTVEGTGYWYPYTESSILEQGGTLYNLLFAGTTSSENYAKSYWLASPKCWKVPRWILRFSVQERLWMAWLVEVVFCSLQVAITERLRQGFDL